MGGPLTPYFLQLDVQNFTEMRNLKKMQKKNRKMVKKSKMPVLEAGSLQNRRFRDFGTLERFLMYIYTIRQIGPERPGKIGFCDFRENFSNFEGSRKPRFWAKIRVLDPKNSALFLQFSLKFLEHESKIF